MPDTVKVLGKPMNKNVVLVGGAAAIGIVGYAWFKNAQQPEGLPAGSLPEPVPVPTDTPGFEVLGQAAPPGTNADWTNLAIERLANIGIDAPMVSAALGKFLAKKPLTTAEAAIAQQAMAVAGIPPENGPWAIINETPGAVVPVVTAPGMVTGLRYIGKADASHARIVWDAVPGATSYVVKGYAHGANVWGPEWPETKTEHLAYLSPGKYSYYVFAKNSVGQSPSASLVVFDF